MCECVVWSTAHTVIAVCPCIASVILHISLAYTTCVQFSDKSKNKQCCNYYNNFNLIFAGVYRSTYKRDILEDLLVIHFDAMKLIPV